MKRLTIALALLLPLQGCDNGWDDAFTIPEEDGVEVIRSDMNEIMGAPNARVIHTQSIFEAMTEHTVIKDNKVYMCVHGFQQNGYFVANCTTTNSLVN